MGGRCWVHSTLWRVGLVGEVGGAILIRGSVTLPCKMSEDVRLVVHWANTLPYFRQFHLKPWFLDLNLKVNSPLDAPHSTSWMDGWWRKDWLHGSGSEWWLLSVNEEGERLRRRRIRDPPRQGKDRKRRRGRPQGRGARVYCLIIGRAQEEAAQTWRTHE